MKNFQKSIKDLKANALTTLQTKAIKGGNGQSNDSIIIQDIING